MSTELDLHRIGRLGSAFLRTEYGKYLMEQLTDLHYGFHQQAEAAETMERKGMLVERAGAVREVIELIMREPNAMASGMLDDAPAEEDEDTA